MLHQKGYLLYLPNLTFGATLCGEPSSIREQPKVAMWIRLICLLFRPDNDWQYPFVFPFPNTPLRNQNSRKQRLTGQTTERQRMEGYQVRKITQASSFFTPDSLLHLHIIPADLLGTDLGGGHLPWAIICWWKKQLWMAKKWHIREKSYYCVWGNDLVHTVVAPMRQRVIMEEFVFPNMFVTEWPGRLLFVCLQ